VSDVVYDAGALIAAERNDRAFWADHRIRLEDGTVPVAPAAVVAQVSRSSRQVQLRRLLRGCQVTGLDEGTAHRIGRLLAQARTVDIVDGTVAIEAIIRSAAVVTSDRDDITHLTQAAGAHLPVIDI
jgi:predicted nucleic acid-binding protein